MIFNIILFIIFTIHKVFKNHEGSEVIILFELFTKENTLLHKIFYITPYCVKIVCLIQIVKQICFLHRVHNRMDRIICLITRFYRLIGIGPLDITNSSCTYVFAIDFFNIIISIYGVINYVQSILSILELRETVVYNNIFQFFIFYRYDL